MHQFLTFPSSTIHRDWSPKLSLRLQRSGPVPPIESIRMTFTDAGADATKRILIVEDNDLNMRLLKDLLEAQGYCVALTGEGGLAVDLARRFRPDLILMDI